jgi:hypothetical protein
MRRKLMKTTMANANALHKIKKDGEREAQEVAFSPFVEFLTRIGFGARGLIYLVIGVIAIQVAQGGRSAPADQQGALAEIGAQPVGHILLIVVMIGLAGYTLWGVIRAIFDPLRLGSDAKGLIQRFWFFFSAGMYASLIIPTYGLITHGAQAAHNGAQTAQTQQSVSTILAKPWGRWTVGIIGILVVGIGLAQIYQGLSRKFDKQFRLYDLSHQQSIWIQRIGRFGTAARGIVFALTGVFLTQAAYQFNPEKAKGIDGVLLALVRQPYGPWLLGLVAVGLIAFGIYSITGAAWFRFKRNKA